MKKFIHIIFIAIIILNSFSFGVKKATEITKDHKKDIVAIPQEERHLSGRAYQDPSLFLVPPTRIQFPNQKGDDEFSFQRSTLPIFTSSGSTFSFFKWYPTKNLMTYSFFSPDSTAKLYKLNNFNSFCDLTSPAYIPNEVGYDGPIDVIIGDAYAVDFSDFGFSQSRVVFYFTDENKLDSGSVFIQYAQVASANYEKVPFWCSPQIFRVTPVNPYAQGSYLYIVGDNLGRDVMSISITFGRGECKYPSYVVKQAIVRCLASGTGSLPVVVKVTGQVANVDFSVTFDDTCKIECPPNYIPDNFCESCISLENGTSTNPGGVYLHQVVSGLANNFVRGQHDSDNTFLSFASMYRNNPLEILSIPRYSLPSADIEFTTNVLKVVPVFRIVPITSQLISPLLKVASWKLHFTSDQARWTKIVNDTSGVATYSLDF